MISSVDKEQETVHVNRTKEQIKASPEFGPRTTVTRSTKTRSAPTTAPAGLAGKTGNPKFALDFILKREKQAD